MKKICRGAVQGVYKRFHGEEGEGGGGGGGGVYDAAEDGW